MAKKLAHLGPRGTFSEEAAILYDGSASLVPCPTVAAVASAVETGLADEGIVAIENSIEGSVTDTLDLLIHDSHLAINHEVVLPITQCLMAKIGTVPKQIRTVYSHPQALGQCRKFIKEHYSGAAVVAAMSTVAAVEEMKSAGAEAAAIAPRRAAELLGVTVLAHGIQDHSGNATRFVVLGPEDHPPTGDDKTSIAFSFAEDKPGQLYRVLGDFAALGINLAKIESRPSKESLGRYFFLVDANGHRLDEGLAGVLEKVRARTVTLKVFGSYPRYQSPAP